MNAKCFIPFVLLVSLVSCGLAKPTPRPQRDVGEESLLPKEVEESVKKIAGEVEKSVKKVVDDFQWIYKSFASIVRTTMQEGAQNVASWLIDIVVRLEFLSMADGSHMFFPLNGKTEIEQDYKTVAIAVSKLLMNLKTMERTDKLVKNVTRHMITKETDPHLQEYKETPEKWLRTFLHIYFENLEHHMEADEDLRTEYKLRKTEAREKVKRDPKMSAAPFKVWEKHHGEHTKEDFENFVKDKKTLIQAAANKLFLKQSTKHLEMIFSAQHHQRYLMARALIQKARSISKSDSKINEVYHQALDRAAEMPVDEDDDAILNVLFSSIERDLESDPTLYTEIKSLMKQIEGSTVYDIDMFYIDFSVL